jgi:tRNA U34 5-methylaminomethyl-2-thiouridine-forming methyltransferase MnmC
MTHDFKAMAWAATFALSGSSGSLCILRDCHVHRTVCARSTRPETKPRISLGVLIDTSAHQKKVIEFQRDVVNSFAEGFAGLATERLSPENWPDEKFSQKAARSEKDCLSIWCSPTEAAVFRTVRFPTCK